MEMGSRSKAAPSSRRELNVYHHTPAWLRDISSLGPWTTDFISLCLRVLIRSHPLVGLLQR